MNISVSIKELGKRKPSVARQKLEVPDLSSPCSLEEFLKALVAQQVKAFNERVTQPEIVSFLLPEQMQEALLSGKVSFGDNYNSQTAVISTAQENALLAFKDGLFKVFLNEEEIDLLTYKITFRSEDLFTFIRLTFLAGN